MDLADDGSDWPFIRGFIYFGRLKRLIDCKREEVLSFTRIFDPSGWTFPSIRLEGLQ